MFTTFLPIIISSAIALTTVGVCHACKDKIGDSYDHYYKNSYSTKVEHIDNVDFELVKEEVPERLTKVYYLYAEVHKDGSKIAKVYNGFIEKKKQRRILKLYKVRII